jgi:Uma2 family endonuclease
MSTLLSFEEQFEMPLSLHSVADFRRWALSDDFPEHGRIDYIVGRIEVNMSPEDFFCHGTLKTEILSVLHGLVRRARLGYVVSDRTRVTSLDADLSAEPDVVFLSHDSLAAGRVRLVPKAGGEEGRYSEVEGAADLIIEIVSDRSQIKDTQRLPRAYFQAGVREFWLADARRDPLAFRIHTRTESGFQPVALDADGFQPSAVLPFRFRLDGNRDARRHWEFTLVAEESR